MSELIHFEYAPPRSWEQFEELCADLFEAAWSDPTLVRHGRAGQRQHGVDIIASRGSIYPVGIQCKKKARWPLKSIKIADIKKEVSEADGFSPALKEFYILTTAVNDVNIQEQVRTFNVTRIKENKFLVQIIFWQEIVRKVAGHPVVAKKHFPIAGSEEVFSPLLASWHPKDGKLQISEDEWILATGELGENFYDLPNGHIIVRQQETEKKIAELQIKNKSVTDIEKRKEILTLRRDLRYAKGKEQNIQDCIQALFQNRLLASYMRDIDESGVSSAKILKALIELSLASPGVDLSFVKIRLSPPEKFQPGNLFSPESSVHEDFAIHVPPKCFLELQKEEQEFPKRYYGNKMVNSVSELPKSIRDSIAIPQIIRRAWRVANEENIQFDELVSSNYLDPWNWKYNY